MAETKMQLVDWLDDLCVRFIINLPQEELESVERICFQVEEAQWFYEDFVRPLDPSMPSMNLRQFCLLMFQHCPLLAPFPEHQHLAAFDEFLAYKVRVPVRGAIMLDQDMNEVVLVKGWKKNANWSFPRGKINKDEDDLDCAIREVYEETGFDIGAAGLASDRANQKYLDVTMREQHMKLFVFRGVPKETFFQPRTRKEISKISWYKLTSLPGYQKSKQKQPNSDKDTLSANKLYMVAPFMQPLKKWIAQQRKLEAGRPLDVIVADELLVDEATAPSTAYEELMTQPTQAVPQQQTLLDLFTTAQPRPNPRMAPTSLPTTDATSKLKNLLSIGNTPVAGSATRTSAPINANANNLLALLRQAPAPVTKVPDVESDLPHISARDLLEPVEQQKRVVPRSGMPSTSGISAPLPQRLAESRQSNIVPVGRPAYDGSSMEPLNIMPPRTSQSNATESFEHRPASLPTAMEEQAQTAQAPRPYQRTGDPQFARPLQAVEQYGSSIPSASQLPAPKQLSSHAQSLLDVFKIKNSHSIETSRPLQVMLSSNLVPSQAKVVIQSSKTSDREGSRPSVNENGQAESRSRQAMTQPDFQASNTQPPAEVAQQTASAIPKNGQNTIRQNALLNLFRSASVAPQAMGTSGPTPRGDSLNPAELAATPIPSKSREEVARNERILPNTQVKSFVQDNVKPPSDNDQAPALVSANDAGSSAVHDLGTVRRKARAAKSPLAAANVSKSSNDFAQSTVKRHSRPKSSQEQVERLAHTQTPLAGSIKILKRPTSEHRPDTTTSSPEKIVQSLPPAAEPKVSTPRLAIKKATTTKVSSPKPMPKPFQPQILRRPQPSPPTVADVVPASLPLPSTHSQPGPSAVSSSGLPPLPALASVFDRPPSRVSGQTNTLLSLFSKPKNPDSRHNGVDDKVPTVINSHGTMPPPSSRPLSTSTAASAMPPPPMDLARSRINSMASVVSRDRAGSGSQTPISPSDRGFLLSYLRGL